MVFDWQGNALIVAANWHNEHTPLRLLRIDLATGQVAALALIAPGGAGIRVSLAFDPDDALALVLALSQPIPC